MKTGSNNSLIEGKFVCEESTHNHGNGLDEDKIHLREIKVKKADDVNISKHVEPLSPVACMISNALIDSYTLTIVGFKKEIDITCLKISLQYHLAEHQRFSSIVVKDNYRNNLKWCLRELVIEDHVIVPCLSPSLAGNPNIVNEYTSSLVTAPPLNPCRPLWEVHVLNVPSEDAAASLVFRIHHSLGDYVSLLSLILNSSRKANDSQTPSIIPKSTVVDKKTKSFLQTVYDMIIALWITFTFVLEVGITLLWKHDKNLLRGGNKAPVSSKRLAHVNLSMDDISLVKEAVNGSLNEVIMGVLSAGLVGYMGRQQNDQGKNASVPHKATSYKNSRLRAMVAVNMRQSTILKDLDKNMKSPSKVMWGNKLGFWMFPLPMLLYRDPLQYCRDTILMSRRKKLSFEASLSYAIFNHMPTKLAAKFSKRFATIVTVGFSNVMGPKEEIPYGDNPVAHIIPTAHVNYNSVTLHFITYGGKGKLVALVSADVVPDPSQLCQDCADALQLMKQAALATSMQSS